MFRVVLPPIIRSAYNCIYNICYLSHPYCHLPLSWKSWNRFERAVGGVRHPEDTQTGSNYSTIAADSSNGVTNNRCCRYSCMCSWWWVVRECCGWCIHHPQHTRTGCYSSTIVADSSNCVTNTRCCRYSCMCSWWWVVRVCCGWCIRHPQHTRTGCNSSTIAAVSSNGVTNTRCFRYSCMYSWWWVVVHPKRIEQFPCINKLCNVAYFWIYSTIYM